MNRHPVRWGSALTGLTFLGAAVAWAVLELDVVDVDGAGLVVAVALIVLGVVGIVATVVVARRPQQPPVPEPAVPRPATGERLEENDDPKENDDDASTQRR